MAYVNSFKNSISKFQNDDDFSIVDRIMQYSEVDFLKLTRNATDRKTMRLTFRKPEKYIAYRIRAFQERKINRVNNFRRGYYKEWLQLEDVLLYINGLREHYPLIPQIDLYVFYKIYKGVYKPKRLFLEENTIRHSIIKYEHDSDFQFENDDYHGIDYIRVKAFYDKLDSIYFKYDSPVRFYRSIVDNYDAFPTVLKSKLALLKKLVTFFYNIESAILKEKLLSKKFYDAFAIKALTDSLHRVELKYDTKQIVKYVNIVWLTQFTELCFAYENITRKQVRKNGTTKNIYIGKNENLIKWLPPAENMIFDKDIKPFGIAFVKPLLTKSQTDLIKKIIKVIEEDRNKANFSRYKLALSKNNQITARINKRLLAERLNMEESNLKHRLSRINTKINKNWDALITSYLSRIIKTSHY